MKLSKILTCCIATFSVPAAIAWPGIAGLAKRIAQSDQPAPSEELIGDLKYGATTPTGRLIAGIFQGQIEAQSSEAGYTAPGPLGSAKCRKDVCCVWSHVSDELTKLFLGPTSRCNDNARAAIRLGFHDAGSWSKALAAQGQDFGGADGSIVLSQDEVNRIENKGLEEIISKTRKLGKKFNVGYGDLIQFMAIHAVVTCPLGPRFRVFVGRKDSYTAAPTGLIPDVNAPADALLSLFEDKTISGLDLISLVGAHSTSRQFFVDLAKKGEPQDDTPGVWDIKFYNVTLEQDPPAGVFKFPSDVKLSTYPTLASSWRTFTDPVAGQLIWNGLYSRAYTRLSLLGVNNINSLQECTKVLPPARPIFDDSSKEIVFEK